jgi:hypothetical protein
LSNLVPGVFAIIQGIGVKETCENENNSTIHNSTQFGYSSNRNSTQFNLKSKKLNPLFSVSIYFVLILLLLCCSVLAFTFLHFSKTARNARKPRGLKEDQELKKAIEQKIFNEKIKEDRVKIITLFLFIFIGSFIMYGMLKFTQIFFYYKLIY